MDVGQAIKKLRVKQRLTQAQLASLCCMSSNAISALEIGKTFPPRATVERICKALCVPIAYFLMASIEEKDFPENKRILYRTQLEPLCNELLTKTDDNGEQRGQI